MEFVVSSDSPAEIKAIEVDSEILEAQGQIIFSNSCVRASKHQKGLLSDQEMEILPPKRIGLDVFKNAPRDKNFFFSLQHEVLDRREDRRCEMGRYRC